MSLIAKLSEKTLVPVGVAITIGVWVCAVESRLSVHAANENFQAENRIENKKYLDRFEELLLSIDERLSKIEGQLRGMK
jgi:hypothetical protein